MAEWRAAVTIELEAELACLKLGLAEWQRRVAVADDKAGQWERIALRKDKAHDMAQQTIRHLDEKIAVLLTGIRLDRICVKCEAQLQPDDCGPPHCLDGCHLDETEDHALWYEWRAKRDAFRKLVEELS